MLRVSRFSSINFDEDWKLPFQIQECYLQKFKPSDQPRVQYSLETASALKPFMDINGTVSEIGTSDVVVIEDTTIREFVVNLGSVVSRTNVEIFFAESAQGSRELSAIIDVDPGVENTVLIEYTNRRNDFDTVFNPANKFSFRVEGCFLPQEVSFDSETESFRDQRHKSKLLSGFPVEKKTLSIGGGFGVPNWAARLINGIFCLSNVEVDGERMIRVDGGVELSMIHNDYPLYIYKIELEHTEDEEVSDILSLLRVVDSKKKVARSTGDDVRVYNAFAKDLGITDSKMIRELSTIEEIAENFYIEIDDNVSSNTAKATLKVFQQFIFNGWIDQPVRTTDDVKFNSVTSSNGKWEISEDGIIKIIKAIVMDTIKSDNFFSGSMGSGFSIMKNDSTGKSYLEIDKIYARFKAIFQSVEIRKLLYSIGNYTYGPAGSRCTRVVETGNVYRCFFTADDGELAVENTFHVDDLVKCQEFNVKVGVHGVTKNRYYWRRCVGVGSDYIDLSKTDCDVDSDIPEVGDDMVAQGNKTDKERQSVIVISVVGEDAPSVTLYDGINDYSLDGKAKTRVGGGSVDSFFTGNFFLTNGKNVQDEINKTNQSVDQAIQDMANTINLVNELEQNVGNLQDQIDGVIETWFYDPVPTLSNEPAVNWTTDNDKNNHLGDLYFDKDGKAYRFENRDGVYQWTVIPDTGLEEALRKAQQAQDTADGKRRIFTTQPTTESMYDVGDLWVNATAGSFTNDILRCKVAKTSGQAFSLSHWELASKYTDDTKANEAMQNAQEAQETADAAQAAADKAQTDAAAAKSAADAANAAISDLEANIEGAFADGIISEAEAIAISKYTNQVNESFTTINATYTEVYGNVYLEGTAKTNLKTKYDALVTKKNALLNAISTAIADGKATQAESQAVDTAFTAYNSAVNSYQTALEQANEAIQTKIKSYADAAQEDANKALQDAAQAKAKADAAAADAKDANDRLNAWASDSVISPTEKQAIKNEQAQVRAEKNEIVADAGKYSIATTTYVNAFNAYDAVLTKYSALSPENITIGADFNSTQTTYYAERTKILGLIADGAKKYVDDIQVGGRNLAIYSTCVPNNTKVDGYTIKQITADTASSFLFQIQTFSDNSFLKTLINVKISDVGKQSFKIIPTNDFNRMRIKANGNKLDTGVFFLNEAFTKNEQYIITIDFVNITQGSFEFKDVMIVRGDKSTDFTPSPEDVDANLEEYKTEVSSQFEKTDERISQSVTETKTYTDNAIGDIKVGSVNLISKKMMLAWNEKNKNIAVWGQDADGVYLGISQGLLYNAFRVDGVSQDIFSNKIKYKSNTQYVFSVNWKLAGSQDHEGLIIKIEYTDGSSNSIILGKSQTSIIRQNLISSKDKTIKKITSTYATNVYRSLIYAISLIEGNQIPTEIPEAVEDITGQSNVNLVDGGKEVTVNVGNGFRSLKANVKPNTVYNISFSSVDVLAGDNTEFLIGVYDGGFKGSALVSKDKKNAILITNTTVTPGINNLYVYAGPRNDSTWSARFHEIMLVEGFVPPSGYSGSENDAATIAMEKTITGINNTPGLLELYATQEQYNSQQKLIGQVDSRITVQAGRIDSIVSDISGLNTRISQTESDIELKVDASGIISAINLSKEGVDIKGDRIEITGQTVFKDSNGNKVNIFGQGDKVLTINNGVFSVSETGLLTSTNADIQGKITATSGKIGGFDIGTGGGYWLSSGDMGLSGSQLTFKDSERAVYIGSNPSEATGGDPITGWLQIGSLTPTIRATDRCALLLSVTGSTSTVRKNYALLIENGDVKFGNSAFMGKPYVWAYKSNGYIPVEGHFVIQALGHTGSDNPCYISNTGAYEGQIIIIINRNTSHRLNVRGTSVGDHWIPDGSCGLFVFSGDMQKWVPLRM